MKKRILWLALLVAVLAFSGCAMRTVEQMYALPKRSEEFKELQSAIDIAMVGLEYAAPLSGDNCQTLQTADLDGDGREEYLVFARGESEKPLQLLIFRQEDDGQFSILDSISFRGTAFEQVEYADMNGDAGQEIILGRQISDQVMGSVSVYTFSQGGVQQLLSTDYSKFLACDLNGDHRSELLVLRPGEAEMSDGVGVLYSYKNGALERSVEARMSAQTGDIKRISVSRLHGGTPAVYVASEGRQGGVVTDVFALREGRFTNIAFANSDRIQVDALRNYAVYAQDLDDDGVLELPKLMAMKAVSTRQDKEEQHLLRWYSMDLHGNEVDKLCTFHNFAGGWYLQLSSEWARYITMEQRGNSFTFYIWNEEFNKVTILFTVSQLTGSDREYQATQKNRFVLYRGEEFIYTARLESGSALFGFTEEYLINSFRLIHQD